MLKRVYKLFTTQSSLSGGVGSMLTLDELQGVFVSVGISIYLQKLRKLQVKVCPYVQLAKSTMLVLLVSQKV